MTEKLLFKVLLYLKLGLHAWLECAASRLTK